MKLPLTFNLSPFTFMNDTIIKVENLSKRYRIGTKERGYKTFREAIIDGITAPVRNFRRLNKLTKFRANQPDNSDSSDIIWALKDVSFEVKQGEVIGIIGRNGAGKSTLLKILSRITEPTSGEVKLYGRVSSLLEVGTGFHPELTGRENIYLNGAILGMRKTEIDGKFDEIVDFAEIEKFIDTPVKRYSSGMYVRLAFAVAAHLEPEILLVDEVLAVGDAAFQKKCLGKMGSVAEQGRTVLFVSHNMAAVMGLTQRCLLMHCGRLEMNAPTSSVVGRYLKVSGSYSLSKSLDYVKRTGNNGKRWKITHVRIVNATNGAIPYKRAIELELEYLSLEKIDDVFIGLVVKDLFGAQQIHCRSTDDDLKFSTGQGETGKIRIKIKSVYLPPGEYLLGLGVASGIANSLDYVPDAIQFEIGNDPQAFEDHWVLGRSGVGARLPSTWALLK